MKHYTESELATLPHRKRIELKIYPKIKWVYARFYSVYGFYWAYKLIKGDFTIPYWEHWALWYFAMATLYFFSREEGLDGFYDELTRTSK